MIKMVVTDLDGTLINSCHSIPSQNVEAIEQLGAKGITRVAATGRSPYSVSLVLDDNFPIDYCIFSSGAGIIDWHSKTIIYTKELASKVVQELCSLLIENEVDFMIQDRIPHNHYFHYHSTGNENPDFICRINHYIDFCEPLDTELRPEQASQIVAIMPNSVERFNHISGKISGAKIIRSTSPLDGQSIWMELFANGVSKAGGISWLCQHLGGIEPNEVVAIGNDYNDIDMLLYTPNAFVVENSPVELKQQFKTIPSNDDAGFAWLIKHIDSNKLLIYDNLLLGQC